MLLKCYNLETFAVGACGSASIVPFPLGIEFVLLYLWCAADSWGAAHCNVSFPEPRSGRGGTVSVDLANLRGVRGEVISTDFYLTAE